MGLFDKLGKIGKKNCSICDKEVGLFGKSKLADGYLCHDCAALLSPFWEANRKTTVAQVQDHLAYRERNQAALESFHPDVTLGDERCVLIDSQAQTFVLTPEDEHNPDLFELAQVRDVGFNVHEHDVTSSDDDGNTTHEYYEYTFYLVVTLDHPQIRVARFAINAHPIRNRGRRIKPRDAEAFYRGDKALPSGRLSLWHRDDVERYMEWYSDLQEMVASLRKAANL